MEIDGTIILDLGVQEGVSRAGNNWKKHEWVLETLGTYPRKVKFHTFNQRADDLRFEMGKQYRISFDLESREFNGRWYTDVSAYQSMPLDGMMPPAGAMSAPAPSYGQPTAAAPQQPVAPHVSSEPTDPFAGDSNDTDDLPF